MPRDPLSMMQGPFSRTQSAPGTMMETDYADSYNAWKQKPSKSTSGALLKAVNPIIDQAIHSYGGAARGSPTLRSNARRMALTAMGTYDPQRGKLKTHLLSQLQRLRRTSAQEQQIIKVPEQIVLDRQHLAAAEQELAGALGRDPSDQEIADSTGLSRKRIGHIRKARPPLAEGTALSRPGVPESEQFLPASQIPGQDIGADEWAEFVYADLGAKDQAIMDYALGQNGAPRLAPSKIAKRMGLSPGAISQRTAKIQAMLDERDALGLL